MSITTGNPESDEVQSHQQDLYKTIQNYLISLGLPQNTVLSLHAAHVHHEDVPNDLVKTPEAAGFSAMIDNCFHTPLTTPDAEEADPLQPLLPTRNHGMVVPGAVYRSSYPRVENHEFIKTLKLKTILTLVDGPVSPEYAAFMEENGIQHYQVPILANKGEVKVQTCHMAKALRIVLDRTNHPLLIHCNKGKHRTGCVVGIIRRIQGYEDRSIWDEYHIYATDKARILDEGCMDQFDLNTLLWIIRRYNWVLPNADHIPLPVSTMGIAKAQA